MKKVYSDEELIQKVLASKQVELKEVYPAEGLYLDPAKEPRVVSGVVVNNEFLADKYSGDIFSLDNPYLTDVENQDEFDF
ncbi:MAG: hypothetical protein IJ019_00080 [Alphaproteobacteria bacterium]|nr:hypothetical protein [Alphaproteobacteria bacterium]